jgi:hypothetical protein
MNLHFITSISKEYWENTAKYCIGTWNLPGKLTVYIDQLDAWAISIGYQKYPTIKNYYTFRNLPHLVKDLIETKF